jgi:CBS-domain-containing membrane protein
MEKTASEGGDTSEQEGAAAFFEKVGQTLRVQRVYAQSLVKKAEASAKTCEALKVASDLMDRDLLEVAEGQTMLQVVEELAKKDLKAVKVASEMFTDAAVTNAMGTAEKLAGDKTPHRKLDGSMDSWTEAHGWLFQ